MEYPELKRAVYECQAFDASVVLIEDKASGTQLIQELIGHGLHAVTRYQPQSDKTMRMHAQTAMIENGFVHLPKEMAALAERLAARRVVFAFSEYGRRLYAPSCSNSARTTSQRWPSCHCRCRWSSSVPAWIARVIGR